MWLLRPKFCSEGNNLLFFNYFHTLLYHMILRYIWDKSMRLTYQIISLLNSLFLLSMKFSLNIRIMYHLQKELHCELSAQNFPDALGNINGKFQEAKCYSNNNSNNHCLGYWLFSHTNKYIIFLISHHLVLYLYLRNFASWLIHSYKLFIMRIQHFVLVNIFSIFWWIYEYLKWQLFNCQGIKLNSYYYFDIHKFIV